MCEDELEIEIEEVLKDKLMAHPHIEIIYIMHNLLKMEVEDNLNLVKFFKKHNGKSLVDMMEAALKLKKKKLRDAAIIQISCVLGQKIAYKDMQDFSLPKDTRGVEYR